MIDVRHLRKTYRVHVREPGFWSSMRSLVKREFTEVHAVADISFHIPEGDIVGFLGPNGAGKTTTMKVLTGLLHPSYGQVQVAGFTPFDQKKQFKRSISLVMGQKSQLIWDVPAAETFLVNKVIYELSDKEFKQSLDLLTELLGMQDVVRKPVRQLSLGERMKCELAAALLHNPSIVFLDEPTIGLDVNMQEAMRSFISAYNRERKATILLTSHYMADVTALCERVMVINRGKLLYDGGMSRLVDRYSPSKRIKLMLAQHISRNDIEEQLNGSGTIEAWEPGRAEIDVPRDDVSGVSAHLLGAFPVHGLTIEEPSMEAIISRAFEEKDE